MPDKQKWKELLKRANKGDAVAQCEVATVYSDGDKTEAGEAIVKRNDKLAVKWYAKGAAQGDASCISSLAYHLDNGLGCDRDTERAMQLYKTAIDMGRSEAAFNLGTVYRDKGNHKKAFEYYVLSMRMDKCDYLFKVGLCYYFGIGVAEDKIAAIRHFRKVTVDKLNNSTLYEQEMAHYYLGLSYLTGQGVNRSLRSARKHFEIANVDHNNDAALPLLWLIGKEHGRK